MDGRDRLNGRTGRSAGVVVIAALTGMLAAGCGGGPQAGGDPGARALPSGQSCQSLRSDMDRMLSRGIQPKVEAAQAGRKLPPQQQAEVDQYNRLLAQYLGARCHL